MGSLSNSQNQLNCLSGRPSLIIHEISVDQSIISEIVPITGNEYEAAALQHGELTRPTPENGDADNAKSNMNESTKKTGNSKLFGVKIYPNSSREFDITELLIEQIEPDVMNDENSMSKEYRNGGADINMATTTELLQNISETAVVPENSSDIVGTRQVLGKVINTEKAVAKTEETYIRINCHDLFSKKVEYDENNQTTPELLHEYRNKLIIQSRIQGVKIFKCEKCNQMFKSVSEVLLHMRRRLGFRPYNCTTCGSVFVSKENLKKHLQRIHEGHLYKCTHCEKDFGRESSLIRHVNNVHLHQKNFLCSVCGLKYSTYSALSIHNRVVHMGEQLVFNCRACGDDFKTRHHLAAHRRDVHSKDTSFQCRKCGVMFKNLKMLDNHRKCK